MDYHDDGADVGPLLFCALLAALAIPIGLMSYLILAVL